MFPFLSVKCVSSLLTSITVYSSLHNAHHRWPHGFQKEDIQEVRRQKADSVGRSAAVTQSQTHIWVSRHLRWRWSFLVFSVLLSGLRSLPVCTFVWFIHLTHLLLTVWRCGRSWGTKMFTVKITARLHSVLSRNLCSSAADMQLQPHEPLTGEQPGNGQQQSDSHPTSQPANQPARQGAISTSQHVHTLATCQ